MLELAVLIYLCNSGFQLLIIYVLNYYFCQALLQNAENTMAFRYTHAFKELTLMQRQNSKSNLKQ